MDISAIGNIVKTAAYGVKKVASDDHTKEIATKILGSAGAAFAGWKVKKMLDEKDKKQLNASAKGVTDEDTKQAIGFTA